MCVCVFCRPHTLTSGSSIKTLQSGPAPLEMGTPYSKQFVHSKSSQYRRMKAEWKSNVYLARSRIQVCVCVYLPAGDELLHASGPGGLLVEGEEKLLCPLLVDYGTLPTRDLLRRLLKRRLTLDLQVTTEKTG